jgi:hypothetical protein
MLKIVKKGKATARHSTVPYTCIHAECSMYGNSGFIRHQSGNNPLDHNEMDGKCEKNWNDATWLKGLIKSQSTQDITSL